MQKYFAVVLLSVVFLPQNLLAAKASRVSVMSLGTKVAAATNNTVVDAECQDSYFSCMDAFCVVENVSGGRCQCSNKHAELSERLKEIMDTDNQAYAISTYGVEHIELGNAADDVLATSERAFEKAMKDAAEDSATDEQGKKSSMLSFDEWNKSFSSVYDTDEDEDEVANKTGDKLYRAANSMCIEQNPQKCKSSEDMLKMMYVQKIRSDCAAFENSLNKQETESIAKLDEAKRNVRDAAFTELQNTNKFSLGECAMEFKKCMRGEDVCGTDWTACTTLTAAENMKNTKSGAIAKQVTIQGEYSKVTIAAATMDALLAKKPLCEYVTNQCVKVKDQVWDVFVKDVAPTIKSVELAAESDLRTNCLSSISQCYIKACKDNMDPKNPDGSYDMCLARPDNYKAFCKVELEPCLAATGGSYDNPDESSLWQGILAQLSSMRVDACTDEFKKCIQSNDRCGKDYSKCIGLNSEDIANICPDDKLTACYKEYNGNVENVRDALARIASGILLNVDNELFKLCENAASDAMIDVCGSDVDCNDMLDANLGTRSLSVVYCENENGEYTNCKNNADLITDVELGKTTRDTNLKQELHDARVFTGVLKGTIAWEHVNANPDFDGINDMQNYWEQIPENQKSDVMVVKSVNSELETLGTQIKQLIDIIESDARVQYCMNGRKLDGLKDSKGFSKYISKPDNPRFPNLMNKYRRNITNMAINKVRNNYYKKYDELVEDKVRAEYKLAKRMAEIQNINSKQNTVDLARKACVALGNGTIKNIGTGFSISTGIKNVPDGVLIGEHNENRWQGPYKIQTTFNMETAVCHKCVTGSVCEDNNGNNQYYMGCKRYTSAEEQCEDIEF